MPPDEVPCQRSTVRGETISRNRRSWARRAAVDDKPTVVRYDAPDSPCYGDAQRPTRGYPQARSRPLSGYVALSSPLSGTFGS